MKTGFSPARFAADNAVTLVFLAITAVAIPLSGLSPGFIASELVSRFARYSFLVFALILPILAGMGINFAMVLGATAGQIGLIFAVDWSVAGWQGLLLACLIGTPISVLLGWFCGKILNKARGREMVTGFILGFFMDGIYQFFGLYLMGWIIPVRTSAVMQIDGGGVRNTLELTSVRHSLDDLLPLRLGPVVLPIATFALIALLCLFLVWFMRTKLGQDMRAVGQDQAVSHAAGIDVDRTRILAIVISTVLACIGQVVFLQNLGNMGTFTSQRQAGFFSAVAILVGGATIKRASILNVFIGVFLVHSLYIAMPLAGKRLFASAQIGQYMADFINYSIITVALVLHSWKNQKAAEANRASLRGSQLMETGPKGGEP